MKKQYANPLATARTKDEIITELCFAIKFLTKDIEMLSICGSYNNTLNDEQLLDCLKSYNETGSVFAGNKAIKH